MGLTCSISLFRKAHSTAACVRGGPKPVKRISNENPLNLQEGTYWYVPLALVARTMPCNARGTSLILIIKAYDSYESYGWYITMTRLNVSRAREEFPRTRQPRRLWQRADHRVPAWEGPGRRHSHRGPTPLWSAWPGRRWTGSTSPTPVTALKEAEEEGDDSSPRPHAGTGGLSPVLPR
jgi:hypothetical protein